MKNKPKNESNNFTFDLEGDFDESSEEKPSKLDNNTKREESSEEEESEVTNLISRLNSSKSIAITNSKSAPKENTLDNIRNEKEKPEGFDPSRYLSISLRTGYQLKQQESLLHRINKSKNSLQENQK